MTLDPLAALVGYWGLALVFAGAAAHKLRDRSGFQDVLAAYDLLPPLLVPWMVGGLGLAEVAVAVGLVGQWPPAALAAALLLAVYAVAMAVNLGRGRRLRDCGCGGRIRPLSWGLVARNVLLVAVSLALLMPSGERALVPLDGFTALCALAALAALQGAVDGLSSDAGGEEAR